MGKDLNHNDPAYIESMRLFLLGKWKEAEEAFLDLEKTYPTSTFVKLILGNIHYSLGSLETSVDYYQKAVELDPEFGNAYYKLGVCYYRMGKLLKALEAFNKVVDLKNQSHAMASYFIGLINVFIGHDKPSLEGFEALRKVSPESKIANFYLAQLKIKQKNHTEAIELLEELTEVTPNFAEVHYMLGTAKFGLGKNTEAIQSFRKALELNPEDNRSRSKLTLLTDVQWP